MLLVAILVSYRVMIVAQISHCCIDDTQPELTGGSEAVRDEKVLAGSLADLPGDDGWCRRLFTGCFYIPQLHRLANIQGFLANII